MNNETNNNKEQLNSSDSNQNDSQNRHSDSSNTQSSFGTYSAIPEIFNNRDTVSQNRNIPMQNKPTANNIPQARRIQRVSPAKDENDIKNHIDIRKDIKNKPSSGRAFVEEFYSTQLNNANTQMPPQKEVVAPMPEINKNADNSFTPNNTENNQKRDVKYNYETLVKPDKKSTSIIILVYIIVIVLLLVGVIGFLLTSGASKTGDEFTHFLKNIDIESVFADEEKEPENPNRFYVTDILTDDDNMYDNQPTLPKPNIKGEPRILKYDNATNNSDFELTIYSPYGFDINESVDLIDAAVYYEGSGYSCYAELISGYSSTDDMLFDNIINPFGEEYSFGDKCVKYPTAYGEATIWYAKFVNRGEAYAFIDMEGDGILSVSTVIFDYQNVPYNQESCILKLQQILDSMLIKE